MESSLRRLRHLIPEKSPSLGEEIKHSLELGLPIRQQMWHLLQICLAYNATIEEVAGFEPELANHLRYIHRQELQVASDVLHQKTLGGPHLRWGDDYAIS